MAGSRSRVAMSPEETEAFLRAATKLQVATVGADGSPHLTTLFHVVLDGRVAFWTYARSQKVRNLERDPRISCLVEDGVDYGELRGVSITGTAEVVSDDDVVRRVGEAVLRRMLGVDEGAPLEESVAAEVARQATKRVAVLVTPRRTATWDHGKLG